MRAEVRQASMALMDALLPKVGETYTLKSRSKDGKSYEMIVTPDGYAVHQGLGCEGEIFNGVLGCWHAKTRTPTGEEMTSLTKYEGGAVAVRTITEEDVQVLKTTICRGATDAELGLFVATCKHTGLDPFMKQIHAVFRNTNVGTSQKPDWQKVMTIQVGVDGYRLIAARTGQIAGMDGPMWSPDGKDWYDFPDPSAQFAKVAIYRKDISRPFVAICRMDAYRQDNHMWKDMGPEQLAKCAEVLGLRRACPAEMAGLPLALDTDEGDDSEPEPPLTRAEVPEGSFREVETPAPVHGAARETPVSASSGASEDVRRGTDTTDSDAVVTSPAPPPTSEQPTGPIALLNSIGEAQGLGGKQSAIKIMTRFFGTASVTKLDDDQKAEYMTILAFRLADKGHEHEGAYTAQGVPVCRFCGDEVAAPEPVAQTALGV